MNLRTHEKNTISLIGGIIVIVGVLLSLFIEDMEWYTSFLGNFTAFGGWNGDGFSEEFQYMLPGILAILGAVFLFIGNKNVSILGIIFIFMGLFLFLYNVSQFDIVRYSADLFDVSWLNYEGSFGLIYFKIGLGWYVTLVGGIIALVGVKTE